MSNENKPDSTILQKSRLSMESISGGERYSEGRISYGNISFGADSRMSYVNIAGNSQTPTKKTGNK